MQPSSIRYLSRQSGAHITCHDEELVIKRGERVHLGEEIAMKLVQTYTDVPIPTFMFSSYEQNGCSWISMTFIPGCTLQTLWNSLDQNTKIRLCEETWIMIGKWRRIPRPPNLGDHLYQCLADGSANATDPLIKSLNIPPTPLYNDEDVRKRIYERYYHYFGRRYENILLDMLPRSDRSVFTHGDVAPQNILVENGRITAILDWEQSGWYPDYWEYANIMRPRKEEEWQHLMYSTAPQRWDLSGINAARRVLF